MNNFLKLILVVSTVLQNVFCNSTSKPQNREHKIHNIVLYPDKDSWCKTTAIVQVVSHPGCSSIKVDNNVCVGACFSYIVPRTFPDTPGDVLPYCDSCRPTRVSWKKVTLECTEGVNKNQNLIKHVELIHDCSCETCKDQQVKIVTNEDVDTNLYNSDTDLLDDYSFNNTADILSTRSDNSSSNSTKSEYKGVISGFLKTLPNEDENILENTDGIKGLHKNIWASLLEKVESMNNSMDPNVFTQLIKSVEEENKIKFNYKRLKQALMKFKKYRDVTKANTKIVEMVGPHHSTVFLSDLGMYSKIANKLQVSGIEQESVSSMLDVATNFLKPAANRSETSYQDNLEAINLQKADKSKNQTLSRNDNENVNNTYSLGN